jgi:hypothetical protein
MIIAKMNVKMVNQNKLKIYKINKIIKNNNNMKKSFLVL